TVPPTPPAPADPVALFAERAGEYRAAVHRVSRAGVAALVAETCAAHGARRLAVPRDLPEGWLPPGVEATGDATVPALDRVDGVLTGCAAASAGPAHLRGPCRARVCLGQRGVPAGGAVGTAAPRPADADLGGVRDH